MKEAWDAFAAWFARNRTKIGGALALLLETVSRVDPQLLADHPRVFAYLLSGATIIFGGGWLKSDQFQRDKQGK